MTVEQMIVAVLMEAGKLFANSPAAASATRQLLNQPAGANADWRVYLLSTFALLCVLWIAARLRNLEQKQKDWEAGMEKKVDAHFQSCDKVKRNEICDYASVKISVAKVMALLDRKFKGWGRYLYDASIRPEDTPEE